MVEVRAGVVVAVEPVPVVAAKVNATLYSIRIRSNFCKDLTHSKTSLQISTEKFVKILTDAGIRKLFRLRQKNRFARFLAAKFFFQVQGIQKPQKNYKKFKIGDLHSANARPFIEEA